MILRSTDAGHSWDLYSEIPYQGDSKADPNWPKQEGFSKPHVAFLPDGSAFCLMKNHLRTGAGSGVFNTFGGWRKGMVETRRVRQDRRGAASPRSEVRRDPRIIWPTRPLSPCNGRSLRAGMAVPHRHREAWPNFITTPAPTARSWQSTSPRHFSYTRISGTRPKSEPCARLSRSGA